MNNLEQQILLKTPNADRNILNQLIELVNQHQIRYITSEQGGATFVVSELARAKGADPYDFAKNYAPFYLKNTSENKKHFEVPLAGLFKVLKGHQLKSFKQAYLKTYSVSIKGPSLWVCNFEGAYSYLVQGSSNASKGFQKLGAASIQQRVESAISEVNKSMLYSVKLSEKQIQHQLILLAAHAGLLLKAEQTVPDSPQSKCNTRRFDLVRSYPHRTHRKVVLLYEIKKDLIDRYDVYNTVYAKSYIDLARKAYGTEDVRLTMLSPLGATQEAIQAALELGVEIKTVAEFANELLERIYKVHPLDQIFVDNLKSDFEDVLSPIKSNVINMQTAKKELRGSPSPV